MFLYLHFSECANHIDRKLNLDINEINMLNLIAKAYVTKQTLFVSDLIRLRKVASQATLHKALKKLEAKNLIYSSRDLSDGRKRKITLTTRAIERYKKLEQAIAQVGAA